jgi:hypothetical protein
MSGMVYDHVDLLWIGLGERLCREYQLWE